MSIAFDASSNSSVSSGNTSFSWSHTCTGSNQVLVVGIWVDSSSSDIVTGVTYNGVALTRINTTTISTFRQYLYAMVGPASGSHSIVVSFTGTNTLIAGAASYTGCSQSGLPDAQNTNTATVGSTSISTSVTTIANNAWLVGQYGNNGGTSSAGSNTYQRQTEGSTNRAMYDSNGAQTPAGSYALNVNVASTPQNSILNVMSIAPYVNAPVRTMSDSIMNSASRFSSLSRQGTFARTVAVSMMNGASRLAVVGKGITRTMSDTIMNAASRLASVIGGKGYIATISDSVMNAASRLATVTRAQGLYRTASDSIMNGASRLASLSGTRVVLVFFSDTMAAARGRLDSIKAYVNGLNITFKEKYVEQNTVYEDKYQ